MNKKLTRFSPMGDGTIEFFDDGDWCYWDEVEDLIEELEADRDQLVEWLERGDSHVMELVEENEKLRKVLGVKV